MTTGRHAISVVGMHRCGLALTARLLSLLGVRFDPACPGPDGGIGGEAGRSGGREAGTGVNQDARMARRPVDRTAHEPCAPLRSVGVVSGRRT